MIVIAVEGEDRVYRGHGPVTIGRDESCDVRLDDPVASRQHLVISRHGEEWVAEDQGSRNGTCIGDESRPITHAILRAGDVLLVGDSRLKIAFDETVPDVDLDLLTFTILEPASAARVVPCTRESVTIGRHPSCDVVIDDPTVSRLHAVVAKTDAGYVINDQKATNAVYAGNPPERVTAAVLYDGDEIRLGGARMRVSVPASAFKAPEPTIISEATGLIPIEGMRPPREVIQAKLAKAPLFKSFGDEDWTLFLSAYDRDVEMHVEHFANGDVACDARRFDPYFRVVLAGGLDALDPDSSDAILSHRRGDFFGLIEAKRSLARSTRHVATEASQVLCVPRHQLRYIERNAAARALLAARHKEESWRVMASQLPLLEGVPVAAVSDLMEHSEIEFFDKAGIVILPQGVEAESVYIVRDGFLKVVKRKDDGPERVKGYLRAGDVFGETAVLPDAGGDCGVATAGKAEIVKIEGSQLSALCGDYPAVRERLAGILADRLGTSDLDPVRSRELAKQGQGYIQAGKLLVMDLELCVKCDLCVQACEELHGVSRLARRGIELASVEEKRYLAPSACRHCDDPVCMFSCPTGAIKRRAEGEIFIDYDKCTGVGACALACPYDNIQMIETHAFDRAQARKQVAQPNHEFFRPYPDAPLPSEGILQSLLAAVTGRARGQGGDSGAPAAKGADAHVPPSFPIKCDLCDGLPFMGCVHACPTGAAMRVVPDEVLGDTAAVANGSSGSDAGERARR